MRFRASLKAIISLIASFMFSMSAIADQLPRFNMHRGVTPISKDIYDLHMTVFGICVFIGVIVFTVLFIALIRHRKSRGVEAAQFHEHSKLEILWAVIPFIILVIMAIPATIVLRDMNNSSDSDLTIKITGYQWKWQYEYLDQGIKFYSNLSTPLSEINNKKKKSKWYLLQVDRPIVIPVNKKVRFLITSNDVIHSWWVPQLGIKKDAVPGFIHEAWAEVKKPGTYRGQCAELCGANHGFMPIVVIAKTEKGFQQWVKQQQEAQAKPPAVDNKTYSYNELMAMGKKQFNQNCAACHQANGEGIPPIYPALRGSSVAVGSPISRHIDIVLHGIPGSAMQAFKDQLNDTQLAAIITYERNAWGNNTGDVIQPSDVHKQRQQVTQKEQKVEQGEEKKLKQEAKEQQKELEKNMPSMEKELQKQDDNGSKPQ